MTRVWSEGFELQDMVGYTLGAYYPTISTAVKRSGAASCLFKSYESGNMYKSITAISEFYLRVAIYKDTTSRTDYIIWRSGGTSLGYVSIGSQITISSAALSDVGSTTLSINTWYLLEIHVKIDDATGAVDVKIDGVAECNVAGDTKPGADTTVDNIYFNGGFRNSSWYIDDIGLNDTAGGVDDSWLGDGRIIVIKPNGDTATLQLTPSAAVDHNTLVDDIPADGDTTYVEGSVTDEEDIYDLAACSLGDVIITRIWTEARAKDTASSGKTIALITKASGGAEVSGGDVALAGTYTTKILGAEELVNPVDTAAWEVADIDALQGGPRTRP